MAATAKVSVLGSLGHVATLRALQYQGLRPGSP